VLLGLDWTIQLALAVIDEKSVSRWDLNQSRPSVVSVQALSLQRCNAVQWEGGVSARAAAMR
jgi:hypothetical protein